MQQHIPFPAPLEACDCVDCAGHNHGPAWDRIAVLGGLGLLWLCTLIGGAHALRIL